jgi:DNA repair photolyase
MKPPIYEPAGKAKEYGDFAINIYTGCTHGCFYCFAPNVLHKTREAFSANVEPRKGIVDEVKKQLLTGGIKDKLIHLCFTCDPYPVGIDTTATREIIRAIKESGNHVQILTKGDGSRDFDLLDKDDWYGVTYTGGKFENEPSALPQIMRIGMLSMAHDEGISTWISCEPVLNARNVLRLIESASAYIAHSKIKIGKLNYHPSDINWGEFGRECERLCKQHGRNYYIKESLRHEMEKQP